jgi:tripartite-type tricarboxylate transporter receptor subunit TctC
VRAATFLVASLVAGAACAAPFPNRPVRIVVPNPAGGTVDLVARVAAQAMGTALGQSVVVEPRPGGDTILGTQAVARAPADGHTVLMISTSFAANPALRSLPYDTLKDFQPLARLVILPAIVAVHPSVPAQSLQELVGLARRHPEELDYAAFSTLRLTAEILKARAGIEMNGVPYQGGVQATSAVVGGHVKVLVGPLSDAMPHIAAGRLRPLAVTSLQRSQALKEVPTVAESGYPGFEFAGWIGAAVPAATPLEVRSRLAAEMLRSLESGEAKTTLARLGVQPAPLGPDEFASFIDAQMKAFAAAARAMPQALK